MTANSHYRIALYFDAIRRRGSIREAARHLGVAASAINRQLLNLEDELGMALFERLPDGMRLTAAGEVIARHALTVLQDEKRAISELEALRGLRRGEISILTVESLNTRFLPDVLVAMAKRYPAISYKLRMVGSNSIPEALKQGEADVGIAFSLPHEPDLQQLAVRPFKLGAVVKSGHPLLAEAEGGSVTFGQCIKHPLVLPSPELSMHSLLEAQMRRYANRMNVVAEVNSVNLMKQLVERIGLIAFQSRLGLEDELATGRLRFLPLARSGPAYTDLGIYVRRGRALPMALDMFAGLVREALNAHAALD